MWATRFRAKRKKTSGMEARPWIKPIANAKKRKQGLAMRSPLNVQRRVLRSN